VSSLATEAFLTVHARLARSVVIVVSLSFVFTLSTVPELFEARRSAESIQEAVDAGSNVLIVSSNAGTISSLECLSLQSNDAILRVGAIGAASVTSLTTSPGVPVQRASVTPGYLDVLAPKVQPYADGAYFGPAVASEFSYQEGAEVKFGDNRATPFESTLADPTRDPTRDRWIYVVGASSPVAAECWIEAHRGSLEATKALIPSVFSADQLRIESAKTNPDQSIQSTWNSRASQYIGYAAGAVAALLVGLVVWGRRSEFALYSILGFSRVDVILIAAIESLLYVCSASIVGALAALSVQAWAGGIELFLVRLQMTQLLVAFTATSILILLPAALVSRGDISKTVRDRG
jgi:hypothetical protein